MSNTLKYENQSAERKKKKIFVLIVIMFMFLIILLVLLSLQINKTERENAVSNGNFSSVRDVLEYYGCQYIKQKNSSEEGLSQDIYTTFKYDLYDNEKSNEKFYDNVIKDIAKILNYTSFKLIDENKEDKIEIKVICDGSKIQTIYINEIEDYFIYMDSKISLGKYTELKTTEISIQSPELINCIQNNWNTDVNFGTRESIFQDYYIFFDEGISIRKINGKIYNVIFTDKYQNQVVNGFTVGEKSDIIIDRMGIPTFESDNGSIIGYKSDDIYVFFEDNQISIYRNIKEDGFDEFFELVNEFLDEKYSLLEFMNELTYLWPDYEEYYYTTDKVFLSYPNKGIDIKINYDNTDGIILYNNIGVSQDIVNKYLEHTEMVAQLQVDNIYNAELRRFDSQRDLETKCKKYQEVYEKDDDKNRGEIYNYYADVDSNNNISAMYFVTQNPELINCELIENIDTYVWLNEYCFIYSKQEKGIYYYDLREQAKGVIITGDEQFKIKSYKNGILKYDEKELQVQYQ